MKKLTAIFDIGKTNKKILFFDEYLKLIYLEEQSFVEITDEDGFPCEDIEKMERWILESVKKVVSEGFYDINCINFTTYGASLLYLDEHGKRLTPCYNYLKPMPKGVLEEFYNKYGGLDEFTRNTASPKLDMLNSGLQILWLKKMKPEIFAKTKHILHLPQYLSYLLTGKFTSEYTSIGCHTAMWDFDNNKYHRWLSDENIMLPQPESNYNFHKKTVLGKDISVGTGLHDSSASLIPYLYASKEEFILISTGTWSIFMNPFNEDKLTDNELSKDVLCYLSVNQKQVKSSRLFMGHIHKKMAEKIASFYNLPKKQYQLTKPDVQIIKQLKEQFTEPVFFKESVPESAEYDNVCLSQFSSFEQAYHQLNIDLVRLGKERLEIISNGKNSKSIYITGGFSRNEIYTRLLATEFPEKNIYTSEIDNATGLGAAIVSNSFLAEKLTTDIDLGLKKIKPLTLEVFG